MSEDKSRQLNERDKSHLRYLVGLANQPAGEWEGFYLTAGEGMNFGLRFQIAFAGYALFALAKKDPDYTAECVSALDKLVEKMLHPDTWAYWFRGAVRQLAANSEKPRPKANPLQTAVEFSHSRLGLGGVAIPPDPCAMGNIQYSAHLASLLGFYQLLSGDTKYNQAGFTLRAEANEQLFEFHYTFSSLTRHIQAQMLENHFGGVCCEPGRAYAACNNHACIANLLHDKLYGTQLAQANSRWKEWVEKRMLTGGLNGKIPLPAPNGLLSTAYMPELKMPLPLSFNLTDAWGLAFMAAWQPDFVQKVYPRLQRRLKKGVNNTLFLDSIASNEKLEISSVELNTGFAAILAREMGDTTTADQLVAWADQNLEPIEDSEKGRYYAAARPAPYVTALFALCEALPPGGGGLAAFLR